ncbi:MAG: hypothetical protein AAFQ66_18400 [Pseudomonadota bacterium]
MRASLVGILRRFGLVIALGLITVVVSEIWFYPVTLPPHPELVLVYGLMAFLFAICLARFKVQGLAGLSLAAGLFGFVAEGVPVTELYRSLPFTILWTSLAWHGLITVGLGLILYRRVMARGGWWTALGLNVLFGAALGWWGGYIWNSSGLGWAPVESFGAQFLVGYIAFIAGHWLLDRLAPLGLPSRKREFMIWIGLALAAYAVSPLSAAFPESLVFLLLLALSILGLQAQTGTGRLAILKRFEQEAIPVRRYAVSLALPIVALPTYLIATLERTLYEANAWLILTAGPLAAALWIRGLAAIVIRR